MTTKLPAHAPSLSGMAITKRVLREYVHGHAKKIVLAITCMILAAGATAANAWLMQPALDEIFLKKDQSMLILIPLAVLAVALINAVATYGQTVTMRFVGQRIIADMQIHLFKHLMHADLGMFHDQSSGRLISRFTNDIYLMRNALTNVLTGIARDVLTLIFLVGVMFYHSVALALIAFFVFPIAIYPVMRLGKRMRKISDSTQHQLGQFAARLDETFEGARVVKAYAREEFEVARAQSIIERLFGLYVKASRVQAAASPMMEMLAGIAIAAVIWYGGLHVIQGTTTPGAFFSFIAAMIMAYKPARSMTGLNNYLQEGLSAASRFFQLIDTPPTIHDKPHAQPLSITSGELKFSQATFRYAEGTGGISDVTLTVPAGKMAALVGPSGGGKSTIINLILRFYDLEHGSITVDRQDIRDTTLSSLRQSISLVSQEIVLFDDTVAANIRYGKLDATDEDVIAAAKDAAADEFIRALPQGYDTIIGPQGVRLSGGQRQRLAIARAMLKNAPILLLDEATSALDTASERAVQQALARLTHNRTTLVVAHRLSTIIHADIVYVIKQGVVVESGTHAALLAQAGEYYQLYAQAAETGTNIIP